MRRLLIRPGAIGDTLLCFPALESLRASYTEVWCREEVVPLVKFADHAESILMTGLDSAAWSTRLRERLASFDEIVTWYGSGRSEFREALAAVNPRVRFLTALPPAGNTTQHATDFYLEQVGAPPGAIPRLPIRRDSGHYAVIHPFSGSAAKNWPVERFAHVARELECEMPVFWSAGPEERLASATRFERLDDLAEWLAAAEVYIGNDSGITHLAAAVGTPVVALFGPTDPRVWGPRGERIEIVKRDRLEDITPHDVLAALGDLLSANDSCLGASAHG